MQRTSALPTSMRATFCSAAAAVAAVATLLWSVTASAEVFVYRGADGTLHFSDTPQHSGYQPFVMAGMPATIRRADVVWDRTRVQQEIDVLAPQYDIDPSLVRAVVRAESGFNPFAISHKGAMGLMQLMPATAQMLGVSRPFDPVENLIGGMRYLRYLLDRFQGKLDWALAAYHAGETRVERHQGVPPIESTQAYVKRVLAFYGQELARAN